jgi:hypothetical protein
MSTCYKGKMMFEAQYTQAAQGSEAYNIHSHVTTRSVSKEVHQNGNLLEITSICSTSKRMEFEEASPARLIKW